MKARKRHFVCPQVMVSVSIVFFCFLASKCALFERPSEKKILQKVVIGYYPSWKKSEFGHDQINYEFLTHLAHAFTKPDSEGNLIVNEGYVDPELVRTAHEHNLKVLMSIGGWGNCEGFPGMVSTPERRERFIRHVLDFCRENNYDGVDIDWEYVSTDEERLNFVSFIKEMAVALKSQTPPLLLTTAVPSGHYWGKWIDYERLIEEFDYISFMTYDYHGEWSDHSGHNAPLYSCEDDPCGSMNDSYLYSQTRAIPREKLLLGIPFFGRSFDCEGLYQEFEKSEYFGYQEILPLIGIGWTYRWDDCAQVPYVQNKDKTAIISFDDTRSVRLKCRYIKERQAAGIIIWDLSLDLNRGFSSLLEVIGQEFSMD